MKTLLTHALLLVSPLGIWALFASAQMSPPTTNDKLAEQEVRRLNAEEVEAFVHNDPKKNGAIMVG